MLFGNAYDGKAVYTRGLDPGRAGEVVREPAAEGFKIPKSPADFLGISAGLKTQLSAKEDSPVLQVTRQGELLAATRAAQTTNRPRAGGQGWSLTV